jgi:threonine aldolase
MDGARLFNAAVAHGVTPSELVKDIDSVQICLSKGLGAPMGSLVCASSEFIGEARFWRKKLGGGLRQAGIVASAGIFALDRNIARLADDHANARSIEEALKKSGLRVSETEHPTNMVYFAAQDESGADRLRNACLKRRVLFNKTSPDTFRLVTHLDVSRQQAAAAAEVIAEEYSAL